jgi:hypothetical protein
MKEELLQRRRKTWELLVVKGYDYGDVVTQLAAEFDCAESTLRSDIRRMPEWIDKLAHFDDDSGTGRLLELRENRQRYHQLATEARTDEDLSSAERRKQELRFRRQIDKAIEMDIELSQSVGETHEEPDKHEVSGDGILAPPEVFEDGDN